MRLSPAVHWFDTAQGTTVDPRLLELLAGIEARGSLRKACDAIGIPYRTAWGLLQAMERACGGPLVRLHRGRGARLAEDGAALLRADRNARERLAEAFESMVLEIGPATTRGRGSAALLRLAASHDLALAQLQDALPAALGAQIATEFCGSLDALRHFRAGQVDIAGFHLVPGDARSAAPFVQLLRFAEDRLIRFVDREQGLIVARSHARRVTCMRDVAAKQLRFVNRQIGSGTRMLIDSQLARERVASASLRGYEDQEYTHAAIAATVASGRADVGFGVAAAAAEYGLAFVPMVRERYYLAVRAQALRSPALIALREALAGPVFRKLVGRMTGYDASHAGELERLAVRGRRNATSRSSAA